MLASILGIEQRHTLAVKEQHSNYIKKKEEGVDRDAIQR